MSSLKLTTNLKHLSRAFCWARNSALPLYTSQRHYRVGGLYEPDYLDVGKSTIPVYDTLNIQLQGYDFPVLENFQRFVHKIANIFDIEVEDGWALPAQHLQVQRFKPQSAIVTDEFKLMLYERNVQVTDVPSTVAPLFIEVIQTSLPQGVNMTVFEHNEEYEEKRYIPDTELIELKAKLEELGGPRKK